MNSAQQQIKNSPHQQLQKIVCVAFYGMLLLYFAISFFPRDWNWGVNLLAFFPMWFRVMWLLVGGVFVLPKSRDWLYEKFQRFIIPLFTKNEKIIFLFISIVLVVLCWLFPVQFYQLGDGSGLLTGVEQEYKTISTNEDTTEIFSPDKFKNNSYPRQPFAEAVNFFGLNLLRNVHSTDVTLLFRTLGIIALVLTLVALYYFFSLQKYSIVEKFLFTCFTLFTASSLYFFGYIELYTIFSLTVLLFIISGWLAIERKVSVFIVGIAFALMLGFHFASGVFGIGFLVLLYYGMQQKKSAAIRTALLSIVIFFGALFALQYSFQEFISRFSQREGGFFLSFFEAKEGYNYTVFSLPHCIDILNEILLVAPVSFAIVFFTFVFYWKEIDKREPVFVFLSILTVCGLAFVSVGNFELGYMRDWDTAAQFFIPLHILALYFLHQFFKSKLHIVFSLAGIMLLQSGLWIALNANEEKSFQRFQTAESTLLMNNVVRGYYYDQIGQYYERKQNDNDAIEYYEKSVALLPRNFSIWNKLLTSYVMKKDTMRILQIHEQIVQIDTTIPTNWLSLGRCYFDLKKYKEADSCYQRSYSLNSTNTIILFELGRLYYTGLKDLAKAHFYFTQVVKLDKTNFDALRGIVFVLLQQEKYEEALREAQIFLRIYPQHPEMTGMLGNILMQLEHLEEAEQVLLAALALAPQRSESYQDLAILYETLGDNRKAITILEKYVSIFSLDAEEKIQIAEKIAALREVK